MMMLRRSEDRGHADHGWLKSFHTFSFAEYHDPAHMGFANLRVINEDRVAPGTGFATHGHREMEIVSYVLAGELAHRDSLGNGTTIRPGEVQRMTAGTGVRHSEFNHASGQETHFLQIWLYPDETGLPPGYEQKAFDPADTRGRLRLVADAQGQEGAVRLHANARLWAGCFDAEESATLALTPGRPVWVQLARGELEVNGQQLRAGDGLGLRDEPALHLGAGRSAEVLVFELAASA